MTNKAERTQTMTKIFKKLEKKCESWYKIPFLRSVVRQ